MAIGISAGTTQTSLSHAKPRRTRKSHCKRFRVPHPSIFGVFRGTCPDFPADASGLAIGSVRPSPVVFAAAPCFHRGGVSGRRTGQAQLRFRAEEKPPQFIQQWSARGQAQLAGGPGGESPQPHGPLSASETATAVRRGGGVKMATGDWKHGKSLLQGMPRKNAEGNSTRHTPRFRRTSGPATPAV